MWNKPYRDEYYTNGVRLSRSQDVSDQADAVFHRLAKVFGMQQAEQFQLALAQSMYTPYEIWEPNLPATTHPWAGHLFVSAGLSATRPELLGSIELLAGWTGPSAHAERAQKQVHVWFDGSEPMGWHDQVQFEPTFGTHLTLAAHDLMRPIDGPIELRAVPHTMLTLATTDLATQVGGLLGLGTKGDVPALRPEQVRFGHGGIDTALRGDTTVGFAVFGVTSWRWQGHDMFVEGGTFREIPGPVLIPIVRESSVGVRLRVYGTQLLMMNNWQTRTFETQARDHIYGTMAIAQTF